MNIHPIISNIFTKSRKEKQKTQQQNLESFGQQAADNGANIFSKKASLAMMNNSIASISFKGREVIDRKIYVGTSGMSISNSEVSASPDEAVERTQKMMVRDESSYGYGNRNYARVDIYYADEGEYITDEMKGKYHYIVKKEEPFLNLEHIKGNYKKGYNNFANEAVREVCYFENLENTAKKSLSVNEYFINENKQKLQKAQEEQERLRRTKTNHVWEEDKYGKQLEEADYFADQNRQKLEDAQNKKALYESQIRRAQECLPRASEKYRLLKELDDKSGEKYELEQKNHANNYLKICNEGKIRKLKSAIENLEAEKNILDAKINYAQINIKNLKADYAGYSVQREVDEYESQILSHEKEKKEKDAQIQKLNNEKAEIEKELESVIEKGSELYNSYERKCSELDKIMEKIENFYREKYPDYAW